MNNTAIEHKRMQIMHTAANFDTSIVPYQIREMFEYRKLAAIDILKNYGNSNGQAIADFDMANGNIMRFFGLY